MDDLDLCKRMIDATRLTEAAMNIPSVSPDRADYDAGLEPPDEPEHYVDTERAPLSALVRAVGENVGSHDETTDALSGMLSRWLKAVGLWEVELTPEEYAEYAEAGRPCDAD